MYSVLFENDDFIAVDKAPEVNFHTEDNVPGLFEQVKSGEKLTTLFPVHRLDKVTSGITLFAKNKNTASEMGRLFEQRLVEKYYLAISDNKPTKKQGTIAGDMKNARRGAWMLLRSKQNPAITQFHSASIGNSLRLFLVKPKTGKTHQIRVALKSIGAPILGDHLYHAATLDNSVTRTYLHAFQLEFELFGANFKIKCPPNIGLYFLLESTLQQIEQWQEPGLLKWPK